MARTFALAMLGLSVTASTAAARTSAPCTAGRTVVRTPQARVFDVSRPRELGSPAINRFGCVTGQRRAWFIGEVGEDACFPDACSMSAFALTGRWFVYGAANGGRYGGQYEAVVTDLRTGRKVRRFAAGALTQAEELDAERGTNVGRGPVTDLVVKENGSIAWINADEVTPERGAEVHVADRDGARLVDSGADVKPGTLGRFGAGAVAWVHGERFSSARLR